MPEEVTTLLELVASLEAAAALTDDLRRRRADAVAALRAGGWTLQRIADAVGRTKQTIDQWSRPGL